MVSRLADSEKDEHGSKRYTPCLGSRTTTRQVRLQKVHSASGDNILHINGFKSATALTLHKVNLERVVTAMSEISTTDILLFFTASSADHKVINRFLLDSGDPDESPGADYQWHVLFHRDATKLQEGPETTRPGAKGLNSEIVHNAWLGASISEVEAFALQAPICVFSGLILILDDEGVRDRTVILAERAIVYEEDGAGSVEERQVVLDEFRKVRVPWYEVASMAGNLWVGNMGFEEFATPHEEQSYRGGWFDYRADVFSSEVRNAEERRAREAEFRRLEADGLV